MENSMKEAAWEYLKKVEVVLQHDRVKLCVFKKVLKDYKDEKIDIEGLKVRLKGLFIEHKELISGFNTFVPKEHQIKPTLELEDGLAFYKAVKNAFQDKKESFDEFLNIMKDWKYERVDITSFVARMKELLKEHTDLILGFNVFLLPKYQITIPFQLDVPETTCNQFKGDDSRVCCSNNPEYYADVSECKDDFEKKRSKRSKRRDFSSIIEHIVESKNREDDVVVCGYSEGLEKLTPKKRRRSNTSHRVEFEILDSSDEGSKKNIGKSEGKNEESNKPLKKRKINNNNNNDIANDELQEERPELPLAFKEEIEKMAGSDVMLVIQKELTMSDVIQNNGRLAIPVRQVINQRFLEPNEKSSLDYKRGEGRKTRIGMSVFVLDPSLKLHNKMFLKKWKMMKSETYNITGKWYELAENNQLKEGEKVQVWSFRCHRQLYFALVKL